MIFKFRVLAAGLLLLLFAVVATRSSGDDATPAAAAKTERVLLGGDELVSGIPGSGSVSLEELRAWLDDARNHVVIDPELPVGLASGKAQIEGLAQNPLTRAKIELGRQLYFDLRLSSDRTISCATCHDPGHAFGDDSAVSLGVGSLAGGRNSPVAYNRILSGVQFWDGRAATLEDQAIGPIANPVEMSNTHDACVAHLGTIAGYRLQLERVFQDGVTIDNVARAIASFERVLVTGPTPWDHFDRLRSFEKSYADDLEDLDTLRDEDPELYAEYQALHNASKESPITDGAIRGSGLFFGKANCSVCHNGANFTDETYHNLGVGMNKPEPDLGRFVETGDEADRGAFKTPTLRNVAQSGPYMHDGSQSTLAEVVEWYAKGGHANEWLSGDIEPLDLTEQDKADLVAFMEALTGSLPKVETGRLPE